MNEKLQQQWSSKSYQGNTGFVSEYGKDVVEWLCPAKGEAILDLGCGDGVLTELIAQSGATVIGIDSSLGFVESAKSKGLDVRQIDAHALDFEQEFDAVFSNAALHWMLRPQNVIEGVRRALKPGGRFVGEMGGFGNVAAVTTAMRAVADCMDGDAGLAFPWFFPTAEQYTQMLQSGGFEVQRIELFPRPTLLPTGMKNWLKVMREPFFEQFGRRKEEAYERVLRALQPSMRDHAGNWTADYVRLRFAARLA